MQKGSGISTGTCVKIYAEEYITLPGGFRLPVSIIREKIIYTHSQPEKEDNRDSFGWMREHGRHYIDGQMIAGQILYQQELVQLSPDAGIYKARYVCLESIGKEKFEEIIKQYGENE